MATIPLNESLVAKIQKLLALASSPNENEALAAMGKAQELLAKYNLDLQTVKDSQVKGGVNNGQVVDEKRGYRKVSKSAMYEWQRNLVATIAQANFCVCWVTDEREEYKTRKWGGLDTAYRKVKRFKILGREGNTTVVHCMVDYLFETIERLLEVQFPNNKDRLSRSAISWREGCAERLRERIWRKYTEMRKQDYATQGEEQYTTALSIRRVDEQEEIANYEFRYGVGSWAASKLQQARWEEESKAAEAAKALAISKETPEQRAAREKREAEEEAASQKKWERIWAAQERERERKANNRDHDMYYAGREAGDEISLDAQLEDTKLKGVL